jgi:hypothetical protein
MRARILIPALIVAAGLSTTAFGQGTPRVVVGDNPSLSGAPLYVALEKGYYREAGIEVQLEMSGTSSSGRSAWSTTTACRAAAEVRLRGELHPLRRHRRHLFLCFRHGARRLKQLR